MPLARLLLVAILLVAILIAKCAAAQEATTWQRDSVVISQKLRYGEAITLPVELGAKKGVFAIDTGAAGTTISPKMLPDDAKLLSNLTLDTLQGQIKAPLYSIQQPKVSNLPSHWVTQAIVLDLSHFERNSGVNIDGILGLDFLYPFVIHLDFDAGELLLCDPKKIGAPPGAELPLVMREDWFPCVDAQLGDQSVRFLIDSGLLGTSRLENTLFGKIREKSGAGPPAKVVSVNAAGNFALSECARCANFSLGEYKHKDLVFAASDTSALGLLFLCRYRVTLDLPHRKSYWTPSRRF